MAALREVAVEVSHEVLNDPVVKAHARRMASLRATDPNAQVPVPGRGGFLGLAKFFHNRGVNIPSNKQTYAVDDIPVQEWHGGVTRFVRRYLAQTGRSPRPERIRVSMGEAKATVRVQNPATGGLSVGHYHSLARRWKTSTRDVEVGLALQQIAQTGRMPAGMAKRDKEVVAQLAVLMFGRETHRGEQNAVLAPMTVSLIQQGHMSVDDAFRMFHAPTSKNDNVHTGGEYPASMRGSAAAMEQRGSGDDNRELEEREKRIVWRWATIFLTSRRGIIVDSRQKAKRLMKEWILRFHGVLP